MSVPVLDWLHIVQGKPIKHYLQLFPATLEPITNGRCGIVSVLIGIKQRAQYPTFRANQFPEIDDLYCRLPSFTLFYQLEAFNPGDLMRLWVRQKVKKHVLWFSMGSKLCTWHVCFQMCYSKRLTIPTSNKIPEYTIVKKRRQRSPEQLFMLQDCLMSQLYIHNNAEDVLRHTLSQVSAKPTCTEHQYILGSACPCPVTVHMEPVPP